VDARGAGLAQHGTGLVHLLHDGTGITADFGRLAAQR
jgi:hypothetical protein